MKITTYIRCEDCGYMYAKEEVEAPEGEYGDTRFKTEGFCEVCKKRREDQTTYTWRWE